MRATPSFRARGCLIIPSELGRKNSFVRGCPIISLSWLRAGFFYPVERWRKPPPSCTVRSPRPVALWRKPSPGCTVREPPPSCAQNIHYFLFCSILRLIFLRSSCGGDIKGGDRKFCSFLAPVLGCLKCLHIK